MLQRGEEDANDGYTTKRLQDAAIREEVNPMQLGPVNAFMTRQSLKSLRRRAYTREQFERLATASAFGGCEIKAGGIGIEVRLKKVHNLAQD